jgi:hypothetical protein
MPKLSNHRKYRKIVLYHDVLTDQGKTKTKKERQIIIIWLSACVSCWKLGEGERGVGVLLCTCVWMNLYFFWATKSTIGLHYTSLSLKGMCHELNIMPEKSTNVSEGKPEQKFLCGFRNNLQNESVFSKKQAKTFLFIFLFQRQPKNFQFLCACTESTFIFYRPSKNNIYLVIQSL